MNEQQFCPTKFADGLPEENLEFLAEFAEEAQTNLALLTRSLRHHEEPKAREFLEIFQAAPLNAEH